MSSVVFSIEENSDFSFVAFMNFLVSYKIMSLKESRKLLDNFTDGELLTIEFPVELVDVMRDALDSQSCVYEMRGA